MGEKKANVHRRSHAITITMRKPATAKDPYGSKKPFDLTLHEVEQLMWDKKPWQGARVVIR